MSDARVTRGGTVVRGGTVIDGTGSPGYRADVRVIGGRIDAIGSYLDGDSVIEADGRVVAPGFIDIHTHYDAQVFWDPALTPSCFHGVTTVVAGNCGFSIAPTRPGDRETMALTLEKVEDMDPASLTAGIPWDFESFPQYLASVRARGVLLNYAAYIGHTPLRLYVMGEAASSREATPEEIREMASLVTEAMDAGAAGFATSFAVTHRGADGRPIPSRVAGLEEIDALCRAVGDSGRGVVGINGGENVGFAGTYELQRRVGAPVTFTALLTTADGKYLKALDIHRREWAKGADVWPQVSCRPLSFSMTMVEPFTLNTSPVFAELMGRPLSERRTAYGDPGWRQRVRDGWARGEGIPPRWDTFDIMESTVHPELVGTKLTAIGGSDPFDALLALALEEPDLRLRVRAVLANDDTDGVATLLNEAGCVLGLSDAGAHVGQLCDAGLPTDLLGPWVRDRKALGLEAAVHKLTGEQAELFGFADRGVIRAGASADLVVFDPETVAPGPIRRVRDFPANGERLTADAPTGVDLVMVNGVPVVVDGQLREEALARPPGEVIAPSHRASRVGS
jgi:N-acyl-D-amino-acid deacylase